MGALEGKSGGENARGPEEFVAEGSRSFEYRVGNIQCRGEDEKDWGGWSSIKEQSIVRYTHLEVGPSRLGGLGTLPGDSLDTPFMDGGGTGFGRAIGE